MLKQPVNPLDQLKAIAGEHFDDYLLVVVKGASVHTTYKGKLAAMGMCKMVEHDIKKSWSNSDNSQEAENE